MSDGMPTGPATGSPCAGDRSVAHRPAGAASLAAGRPSQYSRRPLSAPPRAVPYRRGGVASPPVTAHDAIRRSYDAVANRYDAETATPVAKPLDRAACRPRRALRRRRCRRSRMRTWPHRRLPRRRRRPGRWRGPLTGDVCSHAPRSVPTAVGDLLAVPFADGCLGRDRVLVHADPPRAPRADRCLRGDRAGAGGRWVGVGGFSHRRRRRSPRRFPHLATWWTSRSNSPSGSSTLTPRAPPPNRRGCALPPGSTAGRSPPSTPAPGATYSSNVAERITTPGIGWSPFLAPVGDHIVLSQPRALRPAQPAVR